MRFSTNRGFSLIEVTLALGVVAISLLVIFSLLPIGLQTNQRSFEQTASVDILSAVAADLRATPRGTGASTQFNVAIPSNPVTGYVAVAPIYFDGVGKVVASADAARYRVTITFLPNGTGLKTATFAELKTTWPAAAAIADAQGSAEVFAALDRN